jgi:hypothetical protein
MVIALGLMASYALEVKPGFVAPFFEMVSTPFKLWFMWNDKAAGWG